MLGTSVLDTIKKPLGLDIDYDVFDADIIIHINSAFNTLTQLGVGPENGFIIEDDTDTWDEFIKDDILLSQVKTYIYLKVRLLFDPPTTSFAIDALNKQAEQLEWRLNVHVENLKKLPVADSTIV